jgi:hypothetical protein
MDALSSRSEHRSSVSNAWFLEAGIASRERFDPAILRRTIELAGVDAPRPHSTTIPDIAHGGQLSAPATVSERLPGDVRLSELPAPGQSFRYTLKGWQGGANFGNPSTHHRPFAGTGVRLVWSRSVDDPDVSGIYDVFDLDMAHCPNCGGELKIIAAILDQPVIDKILPHLGLQARAPPGAPARDQALHGA